MKPVLVLQNLSADGPAYLGTWLAAQGVPMAVCNTESGQPFPERLDAYSALAILGGEMSANDEMPSLRRAEALFLQALREGVPTLGHCLGGQLMARALGASVAASPAPEVGWHALQIHDDDRARAWFGDAREPTVFQWHYEAFGLPAGATRLAGSAACPNQAFAIGPHLAMQFHVEIDLDKLNRWSAEPGPRHLNAMQQHATVHSAERMHANALAELAAQQKLAQRIYSNWIAAAQAR